jgi:hypothetical protein
MNRRFPGSLHDPRQPDREGRTAAGLTRDRDVASHHLTKPFADREPEASAAIFTSRRCVSLGEFLEQPAHLLLRHANAGVGDCDSHPVAAALPCLVSSDGDSALLGELVRVARKVEQGLSQPRLVGDGAEVRWAVDDEAVAVLRRHQDQS